MNVLPNLVPLLPGQSVLGAACAWLVRTQQNRNCHSQNLRRFLYWFPVFRSATLTKSGMRWEIFIVNYFKCHHYRIMIHSCITHLTSNHIPLIPLLGSNTSHTTDIVSQESRILIHTTSNPVASPWPAWCPKPLPVQPPGRRWLKETQKLPHPSSPFCSSWLAG